MIFSKAALGLLAAALLSSASFAASDTPGVRGGRGLDRSLAAVGDRVISVDFTGGGLSFQPDVSSGGNVLNTLVFNEVLPDPNTSSGGFDTDGDGTAETNDEFVEIYNSGTAAMDVSGLQFWDISQRNFFTVPANSMLGPGGFLLLVRGVSGGTLPTVEAGSLAFLAEAMALRNGGENLVLYDPTANEYLQMKYGANEADDNVPNVFAGFPSGATRVGGVLDFGGDQDGISLALSPDGDTSNVVKHNTIEDGSLSATPGSANQVQPPLPPSVLLSLVFNELLPDPDASGTDGFDTNNDGTAETVDEFLEIFNTGSAAIDVGGLQFWDAGQDNFFTIPASSMLGPGGFLLLV